MELFRSTDSRARQPGFKLQLCHCLAVCPEASVLTSLGIIDSTVQRG